MASGLRIFESTSSVKMSATRPIALCTREGEAVGSDDASGLLAAMLKSVQIPDKQASPPRDERRSLQRRTRHGIYRKSAFSNWPLALTHKMYSIRRHKFGICTQQLIPKRLRMPRSTQKLAPKPTTYHQARFQPLGNRFSQHNRIDPQSPPTCWICETLAGSQESTIRLASSPNRTNCAGSRQTRIHARAYPLGNVFSANATAKPPSEQSCTESTKLR